MLGNSATNPMVCLVLPDGDVPAIAIPLGLLKGLINCQQSSMVITGIEHADGETAEKRKVLAAET